MAKYVVCSVSEIGPGCSKLVMVKGRPIAIYEHEGGFYGLHNKCPHEGGSLAHGPRVGIVTSSTPGQYCYERKGEYVRCPWHGWEFNIKTGKSICDPNRYKTRSFAVSVASGEQVQDDLLTADTVNVSVEDNYIVVEM